MFTSMFKVCRLPCTLLRNCYCCWILSYYLIRHFAANTWDFSSRIFNSNKVLVLASREHEYFFLLSILCTLNFTVLWQSCTLRQAMVYNTIYISSLNNVQHIRILSMFKYNIKTTQGLWFYFKSILPALFYSTVYSEAFYSILFVIKLT